MHLLINNIKRCLHHPMHNEFSTDFVNVLCIYWKTFTINNKEPNKVKANFELRDEPQITLITLIAKSQSECLIYSSLKTEHLTGD